MTNKVFAERLNKALDDIGAPPRDEERIEVFAKLIKVPKFKAEALLMGALPLDTQLLELLSKELEVSPDWLMNREES